MLNQIRSHAKNLGTKLLLGLLILTFGIWGVEDMLRRSGTHVNVATVGDVDISSLEYRRALYNETENMRQMLGSQFTPEIAKAMNLGPQVLQRLVDNKLLTQESKKLGIRIGDEEIANAIRKKKEFFDAKGKFSKEIYAASLKRSGISEKSYIQQLRDDMAVKLLIGTITATAEVPSIAAKTLLESREEQRTVEVYSIPVSMVKNVPSPTDDQLKEYYSAHTSEFTAPEYRTISYVTITAEDAKKHISNSDKNSENTNIESIYRERVAEFKKPERRKIEQLLFGNEEAANKAHEAIKSGKSFEEISKEANILNPKTISLGIVEKSSLMEEAADTVFSLAKGGISAPIKSSFGWHIFKVDDVLSEATLSLEEVRPQLEKELQQQQSDNALTNLSNTLEDAIAAGSTIDEASKEFGLQLVKLPAIDRKGNGAEGSAISNLPKEEKLLDIAFKTEEKMESPIINGKNGTNYLLRVEKISPERALSFEEVKPKLAEAWQNREKKKQLKELAQKISNDFVDPANRPAAMRTYSLANPISVTISQKREEAKKLPASVIADIFIRAEGDSSPEFEQANGDYGIAVLTKITPIQFNDKDPKYTASLADTVNQQQSVAQAEIMEQYLRFLASKYVISINYPALQAQSEL